MFPRRSEYGDIRGNFVALITDMSMVPRSKGTNYATLLVQLLGKLSINSQRRKERKKLRYTTKFESIMRIEMKSSRSDRKAEEPRQRAEGTKPDCQFPRSGNQKARSVRVTLGLFQ